jgi:hypothetical protein
MKRRIRNRLGLAFLLPVLATACGGGGTGGAGGRDAATMMVSAMVGTSGGMVEIAGVAKVELPADVKRHFQE